MPRSLRSLCVPLLLASSSAFAVFPDFGTDTEYTSVGRLDGVGGIASGVAIDTRWVLTAEHVSGTTFTLPGLAPFNVVENVVPEIVGGRRPDLRLLRVDRDLPTFTRIDTRAPILGTVDIVGFGETGREESGGYGLPGGTGGTRRQASNRIEGFAEISLGETAPLFDTIYYQLTAPGGTGRVDREGGLAGGDSGGGFFYDFGDGPRLVATNSAIGRDSATPSNFSYGAYGFGTYLGDDESKAFLNRYVPQAVVPEPASMAALGLGAFALLRRRKR